MYVHAHVYVSNLWNLRHLGKSKARLIHSFALEKHRIGIVFSNEQFNTLTTVFFCTTVQRPCCCVCSVLTTCSGTWRGTPSRAETCGPGASPSVRKLRAVPTPGPYRTTTPSLQDHHTLLTGPPHPPYRTTTPSLQDHLTLLTGPPHPPHRTTTPSSQDHHTLPNRKISRKVADCLFSLFGCEINMIQTYSSSSLVKLRAWACRVGMLSGVVELYGRGGVAERVCDERGGSCDGSEGSDWVRWGQVGQMGQLGQMGQMGSDGVRWVRWVRWVSWVRLGLWIMRAKL